MMEEEEIPLDQKIAVTVMGWELLTSEKNTFHHGVYMKDNAVMYGVFSWKPSRDHLQALQVAQGLRAHGFLMMISTGCDIPSWVVTVMNMWDGPDATEFLRVEGLYLPECIVKAAALAMEKMAAGNGR